jgi:hypothetical protein
MDIATAWLEPHAVVNRSQRRVFEALTTGRAGLPFPLLGIDADNDSAFINANLLAYCRAQRLTFTRFREYRKNDQAHVEERNGAVIRRLIGYDRYAGEPAATVLNAVYDVLRLWINFFQPTMRLVAKERVGDGLQKLRFRHESTRPERPVRMHPRLCDQAARRAQAARPSLGWTRIATRSMKSRRCCRRSGSCPRRIGRRRRRPMATSAGSRWPSP